MPGTAHDWNVVINGAWNPAILTPSGIARRLFNLPDGTAVEVHVSVDQPGVIRVAHDGLLVTPSRARLLVAPSAAFTAEQLISAAVVGQRALQSLPETPVTAAGVNIRYQFEALPDPALNIVASPFDDSLADNDYTVTGRFLRRSVKWQDGTLNIEIDEKENASGLIAFNFHCASADPQTLKTWLGKVAEMVPATDAVMTMMTEDAE